VRYGFNQSEKQTQQPDICAPLWVTPPQQQKDDDQDRQGQQIR
jgi:hypothetical protein